MQCSAAGPADSTLLEKVDGVSSTFPDQGNAGESKYCTDTDIGGVDHINAVLSLLKQRQPPRVLDTRAWGAFTSVRLVSAVCLELQHLPQFPYLLPDRGVPLIVVLPAFTDHVAAAPPDGTGTGCGTGGLLQSAADAQDFLRRWHVIGYVSDVPQLWAAASALGLVEHGTVDELALARRVLFSPCPLLVAHIEAVEDALAEQVLAQDTLQQQHSNRHGLSFPANAASEPARQLQLHALDVGCGSGRDASWLAARTRMLRVGSDTVLVTWRVTALDAWHAALVRAHDLAAAMKLPHGALRLVLCTASSDNGDITLLPLPERSRLRTPHAAQVVHRDAGGAVHGTAGSCKHDDATAPPCCAWLGDGAHGGGADDQGFHLVLCVRFLVRALLPRLRELLVPGGFILYSTFTDGPGLRAFGRPAGQEHVLAPEELAGRWFGALQGFEVLQDGITLSEDGRELSMFAARRLLCSG